MIKDAGFKIEDIDFTPDLSLSALKAIFFVRKEKQRISKPCSWKLNSKRWKIKYLITKIRPTLFAFQFIIKARL